MSGHGAGDDGHQGREGRRMRLRINGRVQGVFYRATSCREARRLGLTGWVSNRPDGTVELVAEGGEEPCRQLLETCHEGPPAARVTDVDVSWEEPTGEFGTFEVRG